ncbi:hypothetical protein B0H11DRAFT_2280205 [Mycena galericulata]|nr:hypothetical protein B0H11DRAFT_2280205 [Mycena galericulata]
MSQYQEHPAYLTRSAARRGLQGRAKSEGDSSSVRSSSPAGSPVGTPRADREPVALPKSRPVTPALSYSQVVAADLTPAMEISVAASNSVTPSESPEPSRFPSLNPEVDSNVQGPDEGPGEAPWTEVTRKTAHSHRERSTSTTSNVSSNSINNAKKSLSPISRATQDMSNNELIQIARRYQSLANEALAAVGQGTGGDLRESVNAGPKAPLNDAVPSNQWSRGSPVMMGKSPVSPAIPSGEGTSGNKGKGVHPGNWGAADFSEQFSEEEFEAQKAAFANYEEINRVIKSEGNETPLEFPDEVSVIDLESSGEETPLIVDSLPSKKQDAFTFHSPTGFSLVRQILLPAALPTFDPHDYQLDGVCKILDKIDLVAVTPTGSGKTGFLFLSLLVMMAIAANPALCPSVTFPKDPAMVVICPTNSIEQQLEQNMGKLGVSALMINADTFAAARLRGEDL